MPDATDSGDKVFRDQLTEAMPSANVPTLLLLLFQFTGDERWLKEPFTPKPSRWDDNDSGGLSDDVQAEVRAAALQAILNWRAGAPVAKAELTADELILAMSSSEHEAIPQEYADVMLDKLQRYAGATPEPIRVPEGFRVLIIGAGMSGVAAAIRLRQAGVPYVIIEKQDGVGGVWHSHHYPGCGVDTPAHLYSYCFDGGDWSRFFPLQEEVDEYFRKVSMDHGVHAEVRFNTECLLAEFDEASSTWRSRLRLPDGSEEIIETAAVISAVGTFAKAKWPDIPGLTDFDGPIVHTSEWDPTVDLAGKRVAVMGNGASAMQLVPSIADEVDTLTVFQRSRQWAAPFPKFRVPVPESVRFLMREVPHYQWLYRLRLSWIFDSQVHGTLLIDPEWEHPERSINAANDAYRETFTAYIEAQLADRPDLLAKVLPDFPPYAKRMLLDNGWFKALTKPNVTLVDSAVSRVEGRTVISESGEAHEVDVLIVATGYDVARYLSPVSVRGRGGESIREAWDDDDSRAYLGTVVPRFPNFFILYGPNTALGHGGSFIFVVELQVDYVLNVLRMMADDNLREVECRPEVYDLYNDTMQQMHRGMIWSHRGMRTYFRNSKGRIVTNSPWRMIDYWRLTRAANRADFLAVERAPSVNA